jgi:hypothetical protein
MTLSNSKKYELAFAALTHEFVGAAPNSGLLKFQPKNDMNLDGFCNQFLVISPNDYKNQITKNLVCQRLEKFLIDEYTIEQTTKTNHGEQFKNDYEQARNRRQMNPQEMLEAFKNQILIMYTTKAQNSLFESFTKNLAQLHKAEVLDEAFVNNTVKGLFPDKNWEVGETKQKVKTASAQAQVVEEINA